MKNNFIFLTIFCWILTAHHLSGMEQNLTKSSVFSSNKNSNVEFVWPDNTRSSVRLNILKNLTNLPNFIEEKIQNNSDSSEFVAIEMKSMKQPEENDSSDSDASVVYITKEIIEALNGLFLLSWQSYQAEQLKKFATAFNALGANDEVAKRFASGAVQIIQTFLSNSGYTAALNALINNTFLLKSLNFYKASFPWLDIAYKIPVKKVQSKEGKPGFFAGQFDSNPAGYFISFDGKNKKIDISLISQEGRNVYIEQTFESVITHVYQSPSAGNIFVENDGKVFRFKPYSNSDNSSSLWLFRTFVKSGKLVAALLNNKSEQAGIVIKYELGTKEYVYQESGQSLKKEARILEGYTEEELIEVIGPDTGAGGVVISNFVSTSYAHGQLSEYMFIPNASSEPAVVKLGFLTSKQLYVLKENFALFSLYFVEKFGDPTQDLFFKIKKEKLTSNRYKKVFASFDEIIQAIAVANETSINGDAVFSTEHKIRVEPDSIPQSGSGSSLVYSVNSSDDSLDKETHLFNFGEDNSTAQTSTDSQTTPSNSFLGGVNLLANSSLGLGAPGGIGSKLLDSRAQHEEETKPEEEPESASSSTSVVVSSGPSTNFTSESGGGWWNWFSERIRWRSKASEQQPQAPQRTTPESGFISKLFAWIGGLFKRR